MLSKLGFLLLFACAACVVLFLAFAGRSLPSRAPRANPTPPRVTQTTGRPSGDVRLISEPLCNATFLAWIVTSYAGDPSPRSALRRAYADEELLGLGIRRVFLLGTLSGDAERRARVSQAALADESRRFGDILQGDFRDTYKNLTRKHLMGLRWATNSCTSVRYIVKMDDDIVVNLYEIVDKIHSGVAGEDSLTGYVMRNMIPVREPANKWYVSGTEYAGSVYPAFVSGWLYITDPSTASRLVDHADSFSEHLWIDDVFVTGILRRALSIKIQDISELYATDYRYLECCIKGRDSLLKCEFSVGPNGGDVGLQVRFREFARFCRANCSARGANNLVGKTCVAPYEGPRLRDGAVQISRIQVL